MSEENEVSEMWRDNAAASQLKRAANRKSSAELLQAVKISFDSYNNAVHLVVHGASSIVDFWPGTGLWIDRQSKKRSRGVKGLIKHVQSQRPEQAARPDPATRNNDAPDVNGAGTSGLAHTDPPW